MSHRLQSIRRDGGRREAGGGRWRGDKELESRGWMKVAVGKGVGGIVR